MPKIAQTRTGFTELRGNISGKQVLQYPENNNGAYEAPVGMKSYARNYKPSVIVCQRQSDGKTYFQVKQRSAIHMTLKQKKAMAVLGGTGAIVGAILKDKAGENYRTLLGFYEEMKPYLNGMSFRKYLSTQISGALRVKSRYFYFTNPAHEGGTQSFAIGNPWVLSAPSTHWVNLSVDILAKFWSELATNPIEFAIEGRIGVAHQGDTFNNVCISFYNALNLSVETITEEGEAEDVVVYGNGIVCMYDSEQQPTRVDPAYTIIASNKYFTEELPAE